MKIALEITGVLCLFGVGIIGAWLGEKYCERNHMPYKSVQQEKWAHTKAGIKALGGPAKVKEWDTASKGKSLPKKVKPNG